MASNSNLERIFVLLNVFYQSFSWNIIILDSVFSIWVKVFKNGPSKICGRQPLKNSTWSIFEYLDLYGTVPEDWIFLRIEMSYMYYIDLVRCFWVIKMGLKLLSPIFIGRKTFSIYYDGPTKRKALLWSLCLIFYNFFGKCLH